MRVPGEDDEIVGPCVIDDALRGPGLADPRLALDDQGRCPVRGGPAEGGRGHPDLSPPTHEPDRLGHRPTFLYAGPGVQRTLVGELHGNVASARVRTDWYRDKRVGVQRDVDRRMLTKNLGTDRGVEAIHVLLKERLTFLTGLAAWVAP